MDDINFDIVTSCDEGYKLFLQNFVKNVHQIFNKKPYVYDLGIKKSTIDSTNANFLKIDINSDFKKINSKNCIRTTHKPFCIADFVQKHKKPFIFIDADCLFLHNINKPLHDIAFTYRLYSEQTKKDFEKNGCLNAGVIFFKNDPEKAKQTFAFLDTWKEKCTSSEEITDQKALSEALLALNPYIAPDTKVNFKDLSIGILPAEIYNDTKCQTGKIWHFKGAGRRKDKMEKYTKTCRALNKYCYTFMVCVYLQRFIFTLKKNIRPSRYKYRYLEARTK